MLSVGDWVRVKGAAQAKVEVGKIYEVIERICMLLAHNGLYYIKLEGGDKWFRAARFEPVVWGDQIAFDRYLPDWLPVDQVVTVGSTTGPAGDWSGVVFSPLSHSFQLPADHPYYTATAAGYKYWDSAWGVPADWRGGWILLRDGRELVSTGWPGYGVIGYKPAAPTIAERADAHPRLSPQAPIRDTPFASFCDLTERHRRMTEKFALNSIYGKFGNHGYAIDRLTERVVTLEQASVKAMEDSILSPDDLLKLTREVLDQYFDESGAPAARKQAAEGVYDDLIFGKIAKAAVLAGFRKGRAS